ncbi:MAG: hypothetical protein ACR2IF_14580 [Terriglobales bacterium]
MMEAHGRKLMEGRFGVIGTGKQEMTIAGTKYTIDDLLFKMGLLFDDAKPIDLVATPEGTFVVRYYDAQDQRIVAHEFDADLRFINEIRAHVAEWIGEDAYFSLFSGH